MKNHNYVTDASRWQAVLTRDPAGDGAFIYGVITTGVFCRSVCRSRTPSRKNVRFFENAPAAALAGFRPCMRCRPLDRGAIPPALQKLAMLCLRIEQSDPPPTVAELAKAFGTSESHFIRTFKREVGVSPKQYEIAKRFDRFRVALRQEPDVTTAIQSAGFSSTSRVYEASAKFLGMQPRTYHQGGGGVTIGFDAARTALGWLIVAATPAGVCSIEFGDNPAALEANLRSTFPNAALVPFDPRLASYLQAVLAYLDAPEHGLKVALDTAGTPFQKAVWDYLVTIPPGETRSYAEVARAIGREGAARAAARACAANRIALAIPCHRVITSAGRSIGYRWGIDRKRELLALEKGRAASEWTCQQ